MALIIDSSRKLLAGSVFACSLLCGQAALSQQQPVQAEDGRPPEAADEGFDGRTHRLPLLVISGDSTLLPEGDAVYRAPAAVGSVDEKALQERFGGDVRNALRSVPGVFTYSPSTNPAIEVNIRGLTGYGRVNAMIDGVPQNFRNVGGHGSSGGNLLYVHPELLAGVDVARGAVSGAAGAGTLAGAANFRTLEVDDVLRPGASIGAMTRFRAGTNGYHYSGLLAGAARGKMFPDQAGEVSIVGALAHSDFKNYETAEGEVFRPNDQVENTPAGGLLKLAFEPNGEHRLKIGGRWYDNRFTSSNYEQTLRNQTYTIDYGFDPASAFVDLAANVYFNETEMQYDSNIGGGYRGRQSRDRSFGGNIANTSRFTIGEGIDLSWYYGLSYGSTDFQVLRRRGGNPPGRLQKASAFSDVTMDWSIFSLTAGLRYDYWHMSGRQTPYAAGTGDCPPGGPACGNTKVSRSGGELLPKVTLEAQPLDWLQVYATYAHTARPPTVQEMLWTMVAFGDGIGSAIANNLGLQPEVRKGWDVGVNLHRDGVLLPDDRVRLKVGYFNHGIENYIVNDLADVTGIPWKVAKWVNVPGTTRMSGWEIQGGYDAGPFYVNASYTNADTDQPIGFGTGWGNGDAGFLPETYATVDVGLRLFDERLTLGAQMRHVGASRQADGMLEPKDIPAYTLYDAYGSYEIREDFNVFFTVENLFNETYAIAGSGPESIHSKRGRGRTFILGASAKF
ncbi:TonB-dependent receptor domain-containing protein [Nitratireductor pacificus]|uniref:Outer membrane receptor for ferrienterochelin and colicins n=1 Tax=Nitratireductor pacificus pht-3B TaxID=391937 RepID=K2MKY6_9HYPH|nr:TonB-dependent receptor [Nitratireductor pacificus]EKF17897.1 outer membrane receptor for ferrienterochelin and colicins [Nitratireductor pacificus pht-3B]